ncbi:MAG: phenylalanine--tRNA ligase beta subunit-related protein [Candidatus Thermoplasmatota archaeon]|nr:phenylalanine--tRNA ligase beta subunit-related protein [Candidatus Thermoplasmatota archaeon]
MKMRLNIDPALLNIFPDLEVIETEISEVTVKKADSTLEELKKEIIEKVKAFYSLETLKDAKVFRAYRDFFWRLKIDPTKTRPAGEALIRKILLGKEMPAINNVVDCYNLVSIQTGIAIAAFDSARLKGALNLRFARKGESFLGIGFESEDSLEGKEIVVSDDDKIIAIYPYRDSEHTKITFETKALLLIFCGVPGIELEQLIQAKDLCLSYIERYCK